MKHVCNVPLPQSPTRASLYLSVVQAQLDVSDKEPSQGSPCHCISSKEEDIACGRRVTRHLLPAAAILTHRHCFSPLLGLMMHGQTESDRTPSYPSSAPWWHELKQIPSSVCKPPPTPPPQSISTATNFSASCQSLTTFTNRLLKTCPELLGEGPAPTCF